MKDMADIQKNGWNDWAKYVLMSLEDLKKQGTDQDNKIDSLQLEVIKEITQLRGEINVINTKITQRATAIGALAGFIPAAAGFIWMLFKMGIAG
jgi:hypothetical protein